jgi:glycosyltransferase involved in cell wall biosynthesis
VLTRVRAELAAVAASRSGAIPVGRSVSCLCVTRGRPALLRRAVYCFDRQTHLHRELVVVAEADDAPTLAYLATLAGRRDVRPVVAAASPRQTLGDLRNLAVDAAAGTYVAQWDDDDFYHPHRLAAQLAEADRMGRPACVLSRWLLRVGGRAVVSSRRPWEGSVLCRRDQLPRYPSLPRGEDSPVIGDLLARDAVAPLDRPGLYVYEHHGANTWDAAHWQRLVAAAGPARRTEWFPVLAELAWYENGTATAASAAADVGEA